MDCFRRDGLTFDVLDAGPADGDTVVLLHGFPQDATAWNQVAPALHEQGFRTLAPHQRGYSPMARPRGRGQYRLRETTADVLAMLDAAGLESAHVVGHDLGGMVAWGLAGWHPDRVRTVTALSSPHPGAMAKAMATSRQGLTSSYMAAFQLPLLPEGLLLSGGGNPLRRLLRGGGLSREDAARYVARMQEPGCLTGALGWYRAMPLGARDMVGTVRVPALQIWSTGDSFIGRPAVDGTARFVDAPYRLEVLEDVTHWLPELAPDRVAKLVTEHIRTA